MSAISTDDFTAFTGQEHMFFGLKHPFGVIRSETEAGLRELVADTELERIETFGAPKFLTLGRRPAGSSSMLVTHFGCCVRARLHVRHDEGRRREVIEAALTFLFGDVDRRGAERSRAYFDLQADAEQRFTDEVFEGRFLEFRREAPAPAPAAPEKRPWWKLWG